MTYLARLKQSRSGPALPELTEHPSGGFGSAHPRSFSKSFLHTDTLANQGETVCSYMRLVTFNAPHAHPQKHADVRACVVTEPTKPPSGGFVTAGEQSLLQSMEDEALQWLRRFLQYDTVPIESVETAARLHGLSWLIVKRAASRHVIEMPVKMSRTTYWKLPKPPRWQPDDRIA